MTEVTATRWEELIEDKHEEDRRTGCWVWTGSVDRYGYGIVRYYSEKKQRATGAHRAAWQAFVGPIAPGLTIDHLCRNRACVNPRHMEPVTLRENVKRAKQDAALAAQRALDSLMGCRKHGLDDGGVIKGEDGKAKWVCRPCSNLARLRVAKPSRSTSSSVRTRTRRDGSIYHQVMWIEAMKRRGMSFDNAIDAAHWQALLMDCGPERARAIAAVAT